MTNTVTYVCLLGQGGSGIWPFSRMGGLGGSIDESSGSITNRRRSPDTTTHKRKQLEGYSPYSSPTRTRSPKTSASKSEDTLRIVSWPDCPWTLGSGVGATLVTTTYGLDVGGDLNDKYLSAFETGVKSIQLFLSGTSILEFLPILSHIPHWAPGTGYLRKLVDIRRATLRLRDLPWSDARDAVVSP